MYVVTLKMTVTESKLVDWIMNQMNLDSRSEAIRFAILHAAGQSAAPASYIHQARQERSHHPERRSAAVCRMIGPKKRKKRGKNR